MKRISPILLLFFALHANFLISQSIDRDVTSSSGDYSEGTNASVSWTLREVITQTYSSENIVLTQGFQQSYQLSLQNIDLNVLVYLEGPYYDGTMHTSLWEDGQIPLTQPYNMAPWNYAGEEEVETVPDNVVDWVLVELRDAASATEALPSTSVDVQAAFLLNDGSVVGTDGSSLLTFSVDVEESLFVVVWHRNHLGILSSNPLTEITGIYNYDFSSAMDKVYGGSGGYKLVGTDIYGMAGGDSNGDGVIDENDISSWGAKSGDPGYLQTDNNLDGQSNNPDKNDLIIKNQQLSTQVPE